VSSALLVARNLLDDRRSLISVDQERRRRSAQCNGDYFDVSELDRPPTDLRGSLKITHFHTK
jgi:hypothetical protein